MDNVGEIPVVPHDAVSDVKDALVSSRPRLPLSLIHI